ncbi:hypothetical protein F4801DRAFT_580496 [Xylaria longipes]|nr:hypothetical protein F4801DRAFT_580496 [Xylaria longipes]RYC56271.1 hypothetical protein CHU98_g9936 [Xylaria longipes]
MEDDGDTTSNPRRLCENIIWHMKRATFDPCPCTRNVKHSHHDLVQVLFPLKFTGSLKKTPQVDLKDTGAVIFGHNMSLHWHWKDAGDPVKGDPPLEPVIATDIFEDSGVGSSLSSLKSPSTSDPSSSESIGDKSPTPHRFNTPTIPEDRPMVGSKRVLHGLVSSVGKKLKR